MRRFGITAQDYKNMIEKQDYKCAICGSEIGDSLGNRLYVDHNHKTGKVRGLLCSECNFGIGKFKSSAKDNLGEYISICRKGRYLINNPNIEKYYGKIKGNHSGLSCDEMIIPLIIIDTNSVN